MPDDITLDGLPAHLRHLAEQQTVICTTGRPDPTVTAAHATTAAYRHAADLIEQAIGDGYPCGCFSEEEPGRPMETATVDRTLL